VTARLESVGTIGAGNMAEAILRGLLRGGLKPERLLASDPDPARREHVASALGVGTTGDNAEVARGAEIVVLAVKPQQLEAAAATLPPDARPLYLSIVAGATLATLGRLLGDGARVVRSMPNTPALLGAGISALAAEPGTPAADLERAEAVLASVGRVVRVPEALLDAVTGLSGSGPAYAYLFAEALIEAGTREGLPEAVARELAIETLLGAARMLRESGEPPEVLRSRVSSPGGTTLAGLAALEDAGFREAVRAAVRAATRRSRELGARPEGRAPRPVRRG
jgi:pyrroline-5-carboxylate reductase